MQERQSFARDISMLEESLMQEAKTSSSRISRQPDTLMLFYVLPPVDVLELLAQLGYYVEENEVEYLRKNYDFYCSRTSHIMPLSYAGGPLWTEPDAKGLVRQSGCQLFLGGVVLWRTVWVIISEYGWNSAAYKHTVNVLPPPPHTHHFFSYSIATFSFLGLFLSQMVHLIPYPIRYGPTRW